jgi:transposase
MGRRAVVLWSAQNAVQPLCPLGGERRLERAVRGAGGGRRAAGKGPARQLGGEGAPLRQRRQRGEQSQAIGRSRGGRTTKIHALADGFGRPLAFLLTGGQAADCRAAERLLDRVPPSVVVHADKGYDTDRVRRLIEARGSAPNIPPRSHRRWKNCFSPFLYRGRNAIERMFGRLKDFRRIATRYDRLAQNYLAAVCLAATVSYWL